MEHIPHRKTSIWLVEDNLRFRKGIRGLINESDELACELDVGSCEEALEQLDRNSAPDLVLMDIGLPGIDGIEGIRRVKSIAPSIEVIMLTVFDENDRIFNAICAGASGYLLKSAPPDMIISSLREILVGGAPVNSQIARKIVDMFAEIAAPTGDYGITSAEKGVLRLLVEGEPKKAIAHNLGISFHTVDSHLRNIYAKLHVHCRSGAVAKVLKAKLM